MRLRNLALADLDPIELRSELDRPDPLDVADFEPADFEPADFDDVRIAERYGVQTGGHFAHDSFDLEEPF